MHELGFVSLPFVRFPDENRVFALQGPLAIWWTFFVFSVSCRKYIFVNRFEK
jgi:hypothetical protein